MCVRLQLLYIKTKEETIFFNMKKQESICSEFVLSFSLYIHVYFHQTRQKKQVVEILTIIKNIWSLFLQTLISSSPQTSIEFVLFYKKFSHQLEAPTESPRHFSLDEQEKEINLRKSHNNKKFQPLVWQNVIIINNSHWIYYALQKINHFCHYEKCIK